jgi:hypothetical protein
MTEFVGPQDPDTWESAVQPVEATSRITSAPPTRHTETTRYLCAAVHIDDEFADHVVATLVEQPRRAIAPAYGVDLPAVVRHALAARRRRLIRDRVLVALVILFVALPFVRFAVGGFDPISVGVALDVLWPSAVVLVVAWLVVAAERWVERVRVLPGLSIGAFDPRALTRRSDGREEARLDAVARSQSGNVVVFGGWNPFVGSGLLVEEWSFAVDVTRGQWDTGTKARRRPHYFEAEELYDRMAEALRAVGLPGLRIHQRLFIHGTDVRHDRRLLPNPNAGPVSDIDESIVRQSMQDVESVARTYLCVEATGWHGQLVVTMFFRAVRLEGSLFIEGASFALLPLRQEYYEVDAIRKAGAMVGWLTALGWAARPTFPLLFGSPYRLAHGLASPGADPSAAYGHVVNYGATTSIREFATGGAHNRYFLQLDHQMYAKVVSERLLKSVGDFLREHGVDTDEFTIHQTTINRNRTVTVSAGAGSQVAVAGGSQRSVDQRPGGGDDKKADRS